MDWKPIESAPKDGTVFLAYYPPFEDDGGAFTESMESTWFAPRLGRFLNGATVDALYPPEEYQPSAWMPLPPPPTNL